MMALIPELIAVVENYLMPRRRFASKLLWKILKMK